MAILVIAEHDNQSLKASTLNTVAAAARLGGDVHMLVAGAGCAGVAEAAAKVAGVAKVLVCDAAHYEAQTAENVAELVKGLAAGYSHVLAPATPAGKNMLPRVAALLDVAQISDIVAVEAADTFVRPIYAGNALATVKSADAVKVITVRTTAFDAAPASGGSAAIEAVSPVAAGAGSRFVGSEIAKLDELFGAGTIELGSYFRTDTEDPNKRPIVSDPDDAHVLRPNEVLAAVSYMLHLVKQEPGYRLLSDRLEPGSAEARAALGDGPLRHVLALHTADGAPYCLEDRWLTPAVAEGVDFAEVSANEWLVSHVTYAEAHLSFGALTADTALAEALDCPPGAALLLLERSTRAETPITWVRLIYAPGHRVDAGL